jgi:hypothetical protein
MINSIISWTSAILFIIATRKISGKNASNPKVRLKALWLYLIGSFFLISFALSLGAWKFIFFLNIEGLDSSALVVSQSFIAVYNIRGIINCKREINDKKYLDR